MKRFLILAALSIAAAPALATNVVVHIGDPGYYGRVEIAGYPQPQLVYAEPVVVQPRVVVSEPVYVRVPVIQQQNWSRYCGSYGACNRPTYFVQDTWYQDTYVPQYRSRRGQMSTVNQSTVNQQRRQDELTRKMDKEQQKLAQKSEKEQRKLNEKAEKEQQKMNEKAEKEQKKLDKKLGNG